MARSLAVWIGFNLVLLAAGSSSAQNLLANPDFDSVVAPWTIGSQEFVVLGWSSSDVDGSLVSGSLSLESQTGSAYQCVPVVAGSTYALEGFVAPLSASRSGVVAHSLEIEWKSTVDCAGSGNLGRSTLASPTNLDVWNELGDYFRAPPGAQSARIHLQNRWSSGGFGTALFDGIFVPEPSMGTGLWAGTIVLGLMLSNREPRRAKASYDARDSRRRTWRT